MPRPQSLARVRQTTSRMAVALVLAFTGLAGSSHGTLVDLEDRSLPPGSYNNNSGGFYSRSAFFNNFYDADQDCWSGFAYSNVNDPDTSHSDFNSQFAAVTGTGVGGSGTYAIGYGSSNCPQASGGILPQITLPENTRVTSAMFTNDTYAAASMINGDEFAKQFGPGDWFMLTVTGKSALNHVVGSVQLYLAQGTSIVTTWESADLTVLAGAQTLTFDLASSDNSVNFGMNTPAYFAMDDLALSPLLPGDFNLDGRVDGLDLDIWTANLGRSGSAVNWFSGDANGDGAVNSSDKDIWFINAFRVLDSDPPPAGVGACGATPEPSTLVLLMIGGLAALFCRRKHARLA